MAKLTEDQLLYLIEQNGGPQGLYPGDLDNSPKLGREHILEKLKERGYTSLEPAEFLRRWEETNGWEGMREKGYVRGNPPLWLSLLTLGLNLHLADLRHVLLIGTRLQYAYLNGAHLEHAHLIGANLEHARLRGTRLQNANLSGANLHQAYLTFSVGLEEAHLEGADWSQGYELGEEKAGWYGFGEDIYRRLKQWYSRNGQYGHAGEFHFREMECRRKGVQGKVKGWWQVWKAWPAIRKGWWELVTLWAFKLSCGYGERPRRVLVWLGLFLLVPAIFYGLLSPLSGWQALYYSFASLVAFINPLDVEISPWLGTVALAQAYAGYFLLALFLVVLVLKMGHR